ncbi:flippase [Cohnella lupini]|uniref:O-antigen/teichoic acid export membrane protein n=1 Tax=Cohnella lupini TaxID=1294267 RepID=A0A3D9IW48_9BACL|nr:flippase [Cohnella lupini]RED65817.1 O-antigen/teichoic acid export membrane protein [Cohnella lupini]
MISKISELIRVDKVVFSNVIWLVFEKVLKMIVSIYIFSLLARYLGPSDFGFLNYGIAFVFIITIFIDLGLSGLVVKDLVQKHNDNSVIIGTTFYLKMIASIIGFTLLIIYVLFLDTIEIKIVLIFVGISILLKPFEVIDLYNQANLKSKLSVMSKNIALILISLIQIFFVFFKYPLYYFAFAQSLEVLFSSVLLFILYKRDGNYKKWTYCTKTAKNLLSRSWPLILSGVASVLYLKVDQIMVESMRGEAELGIYSVAVRISEAWYFIAIAVVTSLFPQLIRMRERTFEYRKKLQAVYNLLFLIAFFLSIVLSLISSKLISVLFGEEYMPAVSILIIHIWASLFVFMRALLSKWLIIEELLMFSIVSHGFGLVINIAANIILIPKYGGEGAAIATVLAYFTSTYLFTFFSKKTYDSGIMMTKSFFAPVLLIVQIYRSIRRM